MEEQKLPVNCPKCQTKFLVEPPKPEIFNSLRTSSMVAAHDKPVRCVGCGQGFSIVLVGLQVAWRAQAEEESVIAELEPSRLVQASSIPRLQVVGNGHH